MLLYKYDTYNCDYLPHTIFRFYLTDLQNKYIFLFPILRFLPQKLPTVTQRSVSQENVFRKSKKTIDFFFAKL